MTLAHDITGNVLRISDTIACSVRAWLNRRAVVSLLERDERELADMGITHSDVHRALGVPFTDDPSMELTRLRMERRANRRQMRLDELRILRLPD